MAIGAQDFKSCSIDSDCKVDVCNENSCVNQSYQIPECATHNFAAKECHCVENICTVLVGSVAPICDANNPGATYCKDGKTMMVCSGGNWVSKDCVYKCQGGSCIAGCYKNEDCGSSYIKGYCFNNQVCSDTTTPTCLDSGICSSSTVKKCTPCAGLCKEGRCFEETQQPTTSCTDSDGINFYQQGKTCTEINCESDRCVGNAITIIEYYCNNNQRTIQDYGCPNGCKDGVCIRPTPQEPRCSDTDGGINYYVKGTLMMGSDTAGSDFCEDDGITLREESCVPNPGPNQGTMSTNIYKCPNGCKDGACIKGEKQKEEVKCIFKNTKTEQKCYRSEYDWMYCSSYQGSCIVTNLEGYDGEKITWKSSCGGYAYTILDSNNEQIEFDCSGATGNFCQSTLCEDGSQTQCYVDGKGYCVCSSCPVIIIKPVCGNGVCESGEGDFCNIQATACEAGRECKAYATCKTVCPEDCKETSGIYAKLNEKFKLQINQPVKITDYKSMKINFRDLLTPKCEATTTNSIEVKEKLTGMAVAEEIPSSGGGGAGISIIKCPDTGPMAQLEIMNPEEMGKKILTLKLYESKNIYDVSVGFLEYDYASRTGVFIVNNKLVTCPKNCKCDSEGYALECKSEEKCEKGKMLCPDGKCEDKCEGILVEKCDYGCLYNTQCLPIGVRVKDLYCGADGTLTNQLKADENCDNSFECSSNVCVSGKCISSGLMNKILEWFKRLFGGKEAEILDCGGDTECWENAFKVCKPAKISQQGVSQESKLGGMVIEIIGLEGKKCVVKWTAKIEGSEESMKCKFENYALGKDMLSGSMEQYCEGTLTYWLSSSSKLASSKEQTVETPIGITGKETAISACEKIREPGLKYKCTAMLKKNPSDCGMVDEPAQAYCYADVALVTGDSAICKKIKDLGHRGACEALVERVYSKCSEWIYADYCYRDVAALIGDTSVCDQIKHEGGKIECKAVILNDASLCENSDNQDCYQKIALLTGDEKACDELKKRENVGVGSMRAIHNLDEEVSKCIKMAKKEVTGCLFELDGIGCDLIPAMAKNPSLCENLGALYQGDISSKERCYFYAAMRIADLLQPQLVVLRN